MISSKSDRHSFSLYVFSDNELCSHNKRAVNAMSMYSLMHYNYHCFSEIMSGGHVLPQLNKSCCCKNDLSNRE